MAIGLIGRKVGMTRVFTDAGETVPVTVIEVLPNRPGFRPPALGRPPCRAGGTSAAGQVDGPCPRPAAVTSYGWRPGERPAQPAPGAVGCFPSGGHYLLLTAPSGRGGSWPSGAPGRSPTASSDWPTTPSWPPTSSCPGRAATSRSCCGPRSVGAPDPCGSCSAGPSTWLSSSCSSPSPSSPGGGRRRLGRPVIEALPVQLPGSELTVALGELDGPGRAAATPPPPASATGSGVRSAAVSGSGPASHPTGWPMPSPSGSVPIGPRSSTSLADRPVSTDADLIALGPVLERIRQEVARAATEPLIRRRRPIVADARPARRGRQGRRRPGGHVSGLVAALLVGGHVLLEGVPGRGQDAAGQDHGRRARPRLQAGAVHARPDAVRRDRPDDLRAAAGGTFRFREGPVFTNLLLADEINRTPPKTQAALLEAMEERQVTRRGRRPTRCPSRSSSSPPRTRSSTRAPTRCPRPSSTASCSSCRSATRPPSRSRRCSARHDAGPRPPRHRRRRRAPGGQRRRPGRGPGRDRRDPGRAAGAGLHRGARPGHARLAVARPRRVAPRGDRCCCTRPRRGRGWPGGTS